MYLIPFEKKIIMASTKGQGDPQLQSKTWGRLKNSIRGDFTIEYSMLYTRVIRTFCDIFQRKKNIKKTVERVTLKNKLHGKK